MVLVNTTENLLHQEIMEVGKQVLILKGVFKKFRQH